MHRKERYFRKNGHFRSPLPIKYIFSISHLFNILKGRDSITEREIIIGDSAKMCVVVGDESGGWSKKTYGPETMSIALVETSRPYEFGRISEHYPTNTRGTHEHKELKWESSSDRIRKMVLRDVADLCPKIFVATDERKGLRMRNVERFQDLFRRVIEKMIDSTDADHIDFVIDKTPLMKEERGRMIVKDLVGGREFVYKHVSSVESPLVQTQDFVAGAANRARMTGDIRFIEKVNRNIISWTIEK